MTKSQTWEFGCFHDMTLNKQSRDRWLGRNDAHVRHGNANATKRDFSNGRITPWYCFHVPWKMRDIGEIVPEPIEITLLRFRYQWPKEPMNDKSAMVSQSQGRYKHPGLSNHRQFECLFNYHKSRYQSLRYWPFVRGIRRWRVDSLTFPCNDVISHGRCHRSL